VKEGVRLRGFSFIYRLYFLIREINCTTNTLFLLLKINLEKNKSA
jgi:hypothetical protein